MPVEHILDARVKLQGTCAVAWQLLTHTHVARPRDEAPQRSSHPSLAHCPKTCSKPSICPNTALQGSTRYATMDTTTAGHSLARPHSQPLAACQLGATCSIFGMWRAAQPLPLPLPLALFLPRLLLLSTASTNPAVTCTSLLPGAIPQGPQGKVWDGPNLPVMLVVLGGSTWLLPHSPCLLSVCPNRASSSAILICDCCIFCHVPSGP